MRINRLFVYGTLGPGRPNEHILKAIGGDWLEASVQGTLYEEGWGAAMGYPAIVLDTAAGKVNGFLFTSNNLPEHWQELDKFEGEAYQRERTRVELTDGQMVDAYIYTLKLEK